MTNNFLTIPEEIYLLSIDENGNQHINFRNENFDIIIASSVLMELLLLHRIDSDEKYIFPDKTDKVNDVLLDGVIDEIIEYKNSRRIEDWISTLSFQGQHFRDEIITSLVRKGVLKIENEQVFWFFSKRKYPLVGEEQLEEVQSRIRNLVFSDDLPSERDMVIVSILKNSNLLGTVFTKNEIVEYNARISQIAKMDFIGQSIAPVIAAYDMPFASIFKKKTAEEMLEEHTAELMKKFRISNEENLPQWLRKGTEQYEKTLDYVREKGHADITFNPKTKSYSELKFGYYNTGSGV